MYRFLREPKWVAITLAVPVLVFGALMAARWQYNRHVNRAAENVRIEQGLIAAPVPVGEAIAVGDPVQPDQRYRKVAVSGTYAPDGTVLARRHSLESKAGFWVLTPIVTADGVAYLVNRGWVPVGGSATDTPDVAAPPPGSVTVTGWVQPASTKAALTPGLPAGQANSTNAREILTQSSPDARVGMDGYVQLQSSDPAQGPAGAGQAEPKPVPLDNLGAGPHLAYSGQWVLIAIGVIVGYTLIVRREARDRATSVAAGPPVPDDEPARAEGR